MSGSERRSERLLEQGKTRRYQKYHSKGEDEFDYNDYGKRAFNQVSRLSSSDSESFQSVSSGESSSQSDESNATVIEDQPDLDEITYLLENQLSISFNPGNMEALGADREYKKLVRKVHGIVDDINDHFDENPTDAISDIEDINRILSKIEKLRTEFREAHEVVVDYMSEHGDNAEEVKNKQEEYNAQKETILAEIKKYVTSCNQVRINIRSGEAIYRQNIALEQDRRAQDEFLQKTRTTNFILDEIRRMITELSLEFSKSTDTQDVTDEELARRNKELPEYQSRVEKLSKKYQQFLETIPEGFPSFEDVVQGTRESYDELITAKSDYENFVKCEMDKREILKENSFKFF